MRVTVVNSGHGFDSALATASHGCSHVHVVRTTTMLTIVDTLGLNVFRYTQQVEILQSMINE
jgi:hypothetical protein